MKSCQVVGLWILLGSLTLVSAQAPDTVGEKPAVRLLVPPLLGRPTDTGVAMNVVFHGDARALVLEVGEPGEKITWHHAGEPKLLGPDSLEWNAASLKPGTRYFYRIRAQEKPLARGSFVTRRPAGQAFTFCLISDPHIFVREFTDEELVRDPLPPEVIKRFRTEENALWTLRMYRAYGHAMLPRVARLALQSRPDFVINLGDILDYHGFGFNVPAPGAHWARKGLLDYRRLLGPLGAQAPHFMVMGNWDGEKGHFNEEERARSRVPRLRYLPNPRPDTSPEGGSPHEDYYAFTWGDALFVVLNVVSYTPTAHTLNRTRDPGRPDDYTLGKDQLAWLETTLQNARARWKFLCIHHAVGGRAGNQQNTAYARGGGRAARVGEQARIHDLMKTYGVQAFFYGHDHVFTDMVVDGIHYTLPGSCGAPWKFTARETGYEHFWPDSGFARVHVTPDQVEVTFLNADNRELHRYCIPWREPSRSKK